MDATAPFARAIQQYERDVALDRVAFLVAAHAYPRLDVDAEVGRLDALAGQCREPSAHGVLALLFAELGFAGNVGDYYDPRNSFLNDVLDRRTGIPISLAVVTMEVGRRVGVPLTGVGMPGHFLVGHANDPRFLVDVFDGGSRVDPAGAAAFFHAVHGPDARFDPSFLAPVGPHAIVARMLANLAAVYRARAQAADVAWVERLRALVPGASGPSDERETLRRQARFN